MATRQHGQGWKAGFISRRSTAIVTIAREITRYLRGGFRCTKVSASGKFPAFVIMMLSQLGSEIIAGRQPDESHACSSHPVVDLHHGFLRWIRRLCMAVAQAPRATLDLRLSQCPAAHLGVRACSPGILSLPATGFRREACSAGRRVLCRPA
jgi:hypothetical protein